MRLYDTLKDCYNFNKQLEQMSRYRVDENGERPVPTDRGTVYEAGEE